MAFTFETDEEMNEFIKKAYKIGFIDGMTAYAINDPKGYQVVGSCGRSLKEAIENVENTWNYVPPTK